MVAESAPRFCGSFLSTPSFSFKPCPFPFRLAHLCAWSRRAEIAVEGFNKRGRRFDDLSQSPAFRAQLVTENCGYAAERHAAIIFPITMFQVFKKPWQIGLAQCP